LQIENYKTLEVDI